MSDLRVADLEPRIDPAQLEAAARQLREGGIAQLEMALGPTCLRQLADELAGLPWLTSGWLGDRFVNADESELASIGPERFNAFATAGACSEFRVLHDVVHVEGRDAPRRERNLVIDRLARAWATPRSLETWCALLGTEGICNVQMLASRYRPGHFLTPHDDKSEGRFAAFVLSLSEDWRPHWGGLLHLRDDAGEIRVLPPKFGTLTIFTVPRDHFVSQVATYAPRPRFSVAGWFLQH